MASRPFEIIDIDGLTESNRRGIVFLTREGDPHLDAAGVFAELSVKADREVRSRFDYWIDGGINDNYFHGWNDQKHRDCFSFRWKEQRRRHRFYGFLCHPTPLRNKKFMLCVLLSHTVKTTHNTDPNQLARATTLKSDRSARATIQMRFPDSSPGRRQWPS